MKKTYKLNVDNKSVDRRVDAIKYEVKKYIARERRKELPDNADFWDFDCKVGEDEQAAGVVHLSKVNEMMSEVAATGVESFYVEILAKPVRRLKKES